MDVLPHFEKILNDVENPKEMLCKAIAFMSGYKDKSELRQRSLLFNQENMVSYVLKSSGHVQDIRSV